MSGAKPMEMTLSRQTMREPVLILEPGPWERLRSAASRLYDLTAAVIVGLAVIIFLTASLPRLLGYRPLLVTSGSMRPAVEVGDVLLIQPVRLLGVRPGHVITYRRLRDAQLTTHRVVAVKRIQGRLWFQTRGDANPTPDPDLTPASAVVGRVAGRIPRVGYLMASDWVRLVLFVLFLPVMTLRQLLDALRYAARIRRRAMRRGGAR